MIKWIQRRKACRKLNSAWNYLCYTDPSYCGDYARAIIVQAIKQVKNHG